MPDVLCLGELLIDFVSTESGVTLIEAPAFKKAPGLFRSNVAVGLAKLGVSAGFIGKVGEDDFGHFLEIVLHENAVDTSSLRFAPNARTMLAFVSLRADGEREFMFYRHPSADMLLLPEEIDEAALRAAKAFHFGSVTLANDPVRSATLHALHIAEEAGLLISYDPNLRLNLWPDAESARAGMMLGWPHAHVIKVSREELEFLTGTADMPAAVQQLWHPRLLLLLVTDGPNGADYFTTTEHGHVPGFKVAAVDTTGAGDGFVAGVLSRIIAGLELPAGVLPAIPGGIAGAVRYGNAVGALATTERGAIPSLPSPEAVQRLLSS